MPKPHTPFQWEAMAPVKTLQARQSTLKRAWPGTISRWMPIRRSGPRCRRCWRAATAGWRRSCCECDKLTLRGFHDALARHGLTATDFTGPRPPDSPQPWDIVESGVKPNFYRYEQRLSHDERLGHRCPPGAVHCATCGVCATRSQGSGIRGAGHSNVSC